MSNNLFDLTLKVAIELGIIRQGVATGGSTTTVIDTDLLATLDDDYYEQGTCWITDTGDDAAPKGEMVIVSGFVGSTGVATLQDGITEVAAGDRYTMGAPRYKMFELVQQVNNALYMDAYIPVVDESLTTAANQREYTLPLAATNDLRRVDIQTVEGDADRNIPRPLYNYDIRHTATGVADTLVLNGDYAAGLTLYITYAAQHAELQLATDKLNDSIHPDRIVFEAAANAMRAYRDRTRLKHLEGSIAVLERKSTLAQDRHPLPTLPGRQSKITIIGRRSMDDGMFSNWR